MLNNAAAYIGVCGPSVVVLLGVTITAYAAVSCARTLRQIFKRNQYALGELGARVNRLERQLQAERDRQDRGATLRLGPPPAVCRKEATRRS